MVVQWHKLSGGENECTLHIFIVLAICMPKIIKFGGDLTKFRQKQVGSFFGPPCIFTLTDSIISETCTIINTQLFIRLKMEINIVHKIIHCYLHVSLATS